MYIQPFRLTQPIILLQGSLPVYNSDGIESELTQNDRDLYDALLRKFAGEGQHLRSDVSFREGDGPAYVRALERHLIGKPEKQDDLELLRETAKKFGITVRTSEQVAKASQDIAAFTAKFRARQKEGNPGGTSWHFPEKP